MENRRYFELLKDENHHQAPTSLVGRWWFCSLSMSFQRSIVWSICWDAPPPSSNHGKCSLSSVHVPVGMCHQLTWRYVDWKAPNFRRVSEEFLDGGFKYFLFSPRKLGKMNPFWRSYFSNGLKPPTSFGSKCMFQVILNESEVEYICSGQILETSHEFSPQKVAEEGKSPYFRERQCGEIF